MRPLLKRLIPLLSAVFIVTSPSHAQRAMLKSNALYWGTLSPNIGTELRLSRHFTLNIEAAVNPFSIGDTKLHAASIAPEARYWLSARPQAGHFVGLMALGGIYNVKFSGAVHNGDAIGAGVTYGYSFVLGRRWSLEATVGAGLLHVREKKYKDTEVPPTDANNTRNLLAPLKAGVTFVYILK